MEKRARVVEGSKLWLLDCSPLESPRRPRRPRSRCGTEPAPRAGSRSRAVIAGAERRLGRAGTEGRKKAGWRWKRQVEPCPVCPTRETEVPDHGLPSVARPEGQVEKPLSTGKIGRKTIRQRITLPPSEHFFNQRLSARSSLGLNFLPANNKLLCTVSKCKYWFLSSELYRNSLFNTKDRAFHNTRQLDGFHAKVVIFLQKQFGATFTDGGFARN